MLLLHVGASKCGSSAIQSILTEHPVIERADGTRVAYAAVDGDGNVQHGEALTKSMGMRGYRASINAHAFAEFSYRKLAKTVRGLKAIPAETVVLSCEGWLARHVELEPVLYAMGLEYDVLLYVRPPVTFLNSGWWQWGAWLDVGLKKWIRKRLPDTCWADKIEAWKGLKFTREVTTRLLADDITKDFFEHVGVRGLPPQPDAAINRGLPGTVLRLYQHNRELRPNHHQSEIDFVLSKHLKLSGRAPWVLDREMIAGALDRTREANERLLGHLDEVSAQKLRDDARWWSADAYADKEVEPWKPRKLQAPELEALCVELAKAVYELGRER